MAYSKNIVKQLISRINRTIGESSTLQACQSIDFFKTIVELESIKTEDGDGGYGDESKNTGVFYYVKNVEISSIF